MGGNRNYSGIGYSLARYSVSNYAHNMYYGPARALFVTYLDTINRLSISNPANCITRKATKTNPIHYVAFNREYREWLSQSFKSAFGKELIPYILNGANIPLCIGDSVKLNNDFKDEEERQNAYAEILDTYMQVQEQGDGIKSFTGILLYLMIDYYCTFLIDEPESFLHPPQANIMGQIIGTTLTEYQQAFISTHSEEIVKGLTQVCPDRVKIIRITRNGNANKFSILENETFNSVWNDPLLKYSNIMASLFHKNVVLCESDSDCKMYSIIENYNKLCRGLYSETLFIHCGGKHRMAKIVNALHSLDVDIRLIVDIDVLNEENVFREITEAYSIDWESIKIDYKKIVSNLHSPKEYVDKYELKILIEKICNSSSEKNLTKKKSSKLGLLYH
ncbi:hypothetical protein CIY_26860 [Butyrivibrio fibrisolvens 16/4]|nr:hypothetical protein CIY_26860 [Butyrivibrio fibrisolvens 16/4]